MAAVPLSNGKPWPGGVQAAVFAPGGSDAVFVVDGCGGVTAWDLRHSAQPSLCAPAADDATGEGNLKRQVTTLFRVLGFRLLRN